MNEEEDKEMERRSQLLESLEHNEAFKLWRELACDPVLEQLEFMLADSDKLPEPVLRANVKLKYLVKDMFYRLFDQIRAVNDQERNLNK